eukprot:TRINITY_DN3665_c0_g1_i1.p4 TRINITY_DN3665_c0_g1~~TRINITY_DN3665_c0_g1_i1.p4  ORF type:complete len:147 (+),score=8.08 TRINITY_DN3665_c0_g1_i1:361-801(+)
MFRIINYINFYNMINFNGSLYHNQFVLTSIKLQVNNQLAYQEKRIQLELEKSDAAKFCGGVIHNSFICENNKRLEHSESKLNKLLIIWYLLCINRVGSKLILSSGQTLGVKAQRFRGHTSPHRNVKEKKGGQKDWLNYFQQVQIHW